MTYIHRTDVHNTSAAKEVVPIVINMIQPKSVIDVGCGLGTWLAVFETFGVSDVLGVDGVYVDRSLLCIADNKFLTTDLINPLQLNRQYDLVVSLEVAEHLPESAADEFVQTLTSLGDTILFSAAIPGQDGQNHLNEQWPEYWREKFAKYRYVFNDVIRDKIWWNEKVEWWYRQNMFLVSKKVINEESQDKPLARIHPGLLKFKVEELNQLERKLQQRIEDFEKGEVGVQIGFNILKKAIQRKIK